jgi:radical SAM superfamily enzyme YgiQ (UPF0313 family)
MDVILITGVSGIVFQRSIGAYQIAHHLRQNMISCQVIDFIYDFEENELLEIIEKFIDKNTLCIGVSTTFMSDTRVGLSNKSKLSLTIPSHLNSVLENLKSKYNNIKFCIGGSQAKCGLEVSWADSVFYGYSEDTFLEYCLNLKNGQKNYFVKRENKKTVYDKENTVFDIEHLNHRFLVNDCITYSETLPIEISRGCIFKCKFCAYPLNGKKKLDFIRDSKEVATELMYNFEKFGITNYFFADDTFNDSLDKLENLNEEIKKLPFKIKFTCYLRLDLLYSNRKMIPILKEMGLVSVFFGLESFCQESLKIIGKNLKVEKIKTFLDELYFVHWEEQVSFSLGFIIGLPNETETSIKETLEWLSNKPYSFHFEPLRISPNLNKYQSEFEKNWEKYGYKFDENNNWYNETLHEQLSQELANKINNKYAYKENKPSSWILMALLNHFTYEDVITKTMESIKYKNILKTRKQRILKYKRLLLDIIN